MKKFIKKNILASTFIALALFAATVRTVSAYIYNPTTSGGSSGVSSLNSLTGALSIVAGTGISVTPSGSNVTIANTGLTATPTLTQVMTAGNLLPGATPLKLTTASQSVLHDTFGNAIISTSGAGNLILRGTTSDLHMLANTLRFTDGGAGTGGRLQYQDGFQDTGYLMSSLDSSGTMRWIDKSTLPFVNLISSKYILNQTSTITVDSGTVATTGQYSIGGWLTLTSALGPAVGLSITYTDQNGNIQVESIKQSGGGTSFGSTGTYLLDSVTAVLKSGTTWSIDATVSGIGTINYDAGETLTFVPAS